MLRSRIWIFMLATFIPTSFIFTMFIFVIDSPEPNNVENYIFTVEKEVENNSHQKDAMKRKTPAIILFWSTLYGRRNHWKWWFKKEFLQKWCPEEMDCVFTLDKGRLNESDAVLFHGFLGDLNRTQMPIHRLPHQRWIYVLNESPQSPLRNLTEFNNIFNWTLTYRRESDIFGGYGEIILKDRKDKHGDLRVNHAENKTRLIAWFVSHCSTEGRRERFARELQKYVPIHIYGDCGNGNFSCRHRYSFECFKMLEDNYKFYLAFENHLCTDYITEKFFGILPYYVVPVVFGGDGYDNIVPKNSYINALDFASPKQLADYLLLLDKNDTLYNQYFEWKHGKKVRIIRWERTNCEICRKVKDETLPIKIYKDLGYWWNTLGNCHRWEDGKVIRHS